MDFDSDQRVFEIGEVKVGGQPGELPTVLIGSIFHQGHGIVKDRGKGIFDRKKAEKLLKKQEKVSKRTGIPCMVDVVAESKVAMERNLEFVSKRTEFPLLINATNAEVRLHGTRVAHEMGIIDRAVYDSINYRLDEEEISGIRDTGVEAAVIQAFNPRNPMPKGMVDVIENDQGGLLQGAREAGITKPLLFAPVLDLPSIGLAARGISLLKDRFGLPCGTAPVGVVGRAEQVKALGRSVKRSCRSAALSMCQAAGADYVIYGTMDRCNRVIPAAAVVDAAISYGARTSGTRPKVPGPLKVMFGSRS